MGYTVYLKDTTTGETGSKYFPYIYKNFIWREGNYSCDCNRAIFLYDDEVDVPCNTEDNEIIITSIKDDAGQELWL